MIEPTPRNPLIDRYVWLDPEDQFPSLELVNQTLTSLLLDLQDVIPEVEIPQISPLLGTVNDRDSDPVILESPSVPYDLPDGNQARLLLSVCRPRVLHELNLDANSWSTLALHVDSSPYLQMTDFTKVAWISSGWGFEMKNSRSVVRAGTVRQLGQFVSACHFIRDALI